MNPPSLSVYFRQILVGWGFLALLLIGYTDFTNLSTVVNADYLMTFHTAGWIADHNQFDILYPQDGAITFAGEPFDLKAHELLPLLKEYAVAEYMYMPVSAYLFAPFSRLSPSFSLFAFQVVSFILMALSACFTLGFKPIGRWFSATLALLAFIPTFFTLWIGQVGLVFGLFPLTAGYALSLRSKNFAAGFCFALLALKPQMLVPAAFVLALSIFQKRLGMLGGFIAGGMTLVAVNYFVMGQRLLLSWFDCLKLSDKIYSDPTNGVPIRLATSLPRAILLALPADCRAVCKPVVYGISILLLLAGIALVFAAARSRLKDEDKTRLALISGCLALPCVVPHLFLYDLCVLAPVGWLAFAGGFKSLRGLVSLLWISVTIYCLTLVSFPDLVSPVILVSIFVFIYLTALVNLCMHKVRASA